MSFRLFIYYCALCGGWAALLGWAVGRLLAPNDDLGYVGILGLFLGLMVALGLSLVDSMWNLGLRQPGKVMGRVSVALVVGAVGGLVGGMLGQVLLQESQVFFVVGWTLTGLLVGASIGVFEILSSLVRQCDVTWARKKLLKCLIGGTVGGIIGGTLALLLKLGWESILASRGQVADMRSLWSPTALGFVALGMCIGLLVGLAQVILKEAWIRVEAGFRPGREIILAKERTTVGRAEACDIGLFGDNTIEKLHASILQASNGYYYVEDSSTPVGTFVNDQPVRGRMQLNSGDLIRVGKSLLRFNERQKRR
jgi:FHA domain